MTSTPTTRATKALHHVHDQLTASALILETNAESPESCKQGADTMLACALEFRRLARILMGDIGEEQTEIESEPAEMPITVPAEPVKVPA